MVSERSPRRRQSFFLRLSLLLGLAMVTLATPVFALNGRISATVRDDAETPLAGITVRFIPVGGGPAREMTTNKKGRFSHSFFPTGRYRVELADASLYVQWLSLKISDGSGIEIHQQEGATDPEAGVPPISLSADQRVALVFEVVGAEVREERKRAVSLAAVSKDLQKAKDEFDRGNMEQVLDETEKLLKKNKDVGAVHYMRGMALARLERTEPAVEALRLAVELSPDQPGFRGALGTSLVQHGIELKDVSAPEPARRAFAEAAGLLESEVALDPESVQMLLNLALAQEHLEDDQALLATLERLATLDPTETAHRLRWAQTLIRTGDDARALELLQGTGGAGPEAAPLAYNIAANQFNDGNLEEAIASATLGLGYDPELADLHRVLGRAHMSLGNDDEAVAAMARFVELAPDDPTADVERELIRRLQGTP